MTKSARGSALAAVAVAAVVVGAAVVGCGGDSKPAGVTTPTATKTVSAAGGSVSVAPAPGASLTASFPASAVGGDTAVTLTAVGSGALPAPITAGLPGATAAVERRGRGFTANAGNVYVTAFKIDAAGVTVFNVPVAIGASKVTQLPASTLLNVAELKQGAWVDVTTAMTDASGGFATLQPSAALPGVLEPGTYVVYQPASGTNTAVANFGIALVADDGNGATSGLQVINLYDAQGNPLAKPALKLLAYDGAGDLDGAALTPDGSQGILVDGGNTVRFFSAVQTGAPIASTQTVDISAYGGDGDSVAILPNGDEAVVSGDGDSLLVVSGILGGTPVAATTIAVPGARDGLVISDDGKVLLARGSSGLTVFAIQAVPAAPGSIGGTVAHTFQQTADLTQAAASGMEDGRDGMASDPADSSRAVVVGYDASYNASIQLLTGLPAHPVLAATPITGVGTVYAVAVTPDGKKAIVGTDKGLVLFTGVDGAALVQVGAPYSATFTGSDGATYGLDAAGVPTLGITLDGKYVAAMTSSPSATAGTLLVVPIQATGLGAPVGQLDGVAVPQNDQLMMH